MNTKNSLELDFIDSIWNCFMSRIKILIKHWSIALHVYSLIIFSPSILFAQADPPIDFKPLTFASPNVSSLGKYGQLPVDISSGVPNISIPLYEIIEGDIRIPISLSYHAAGIKVEEQASWVGLGWSLQSSGTLSREVRGQEDDDVGGFYHSGGAMINEIVPTYRFPPVYNSLLTGFDVDTDAKRETLLALSATYDSESDIYSFNTANGLTGKFFFTNQGEISSMPFQNIDIQYLNNLPDVSISGWKITDPKGLKYTFGSRESIQTDDGRIASNTWFLDSISDLNKSKVKFNYKHYTHGYWNFQWERLGGGEPGGALNESYYGFNSVTTRILDSIVSNNMKVIFYAHKNRSDIENDYRLDSLIVLNSDNQLIRRVAFQYSYFEGAGAPHDFYETNNKRLKLDGIVINGQEKYSFEYNETELPSRFSKDQDLWGYYNAANNTSLVPAYLEPLTSPDVVIEGTGNRAPNRNAMQACILKKINYPTGGATLFEYEPHQIRTKKFNCIPCFLFYKDTTAVKTYGVNNGNYVTTEINYSYGSGRIKFETFPIQEVPGWKNKVVIDLLEGTTLIWRKNAEELTELIAPFGNYTLKVYGNTSETIYFGLTMKWKKPSEVISAGNNPDVNMTIGGLRIKNLTDYDPITNKQLVTNYKYQLEEDTTVSSGSVVNFPVHYERFFAPALWFDQNCNLLGLAPNHPLNLPSAWRYTSFSSEPLQFSGSQYVGYSTVVKEQNESKANGRIVYFFTDAQTDPDIKFTPDNFDFPKTPKTSLQWSRGLLLKETYYKYTGSQLVKIKETENFYTRKNTFSDPNRLKSSVNMKGYLYHPVGPETCYLQDLAFAYLKLWRPFVLLTGWNELDSTVEKSFESNGVFKTATFYKYSNPYTANQLSIVEKENPDSKGGSIIERYKYPFHYDGISSNNSFGIKHLQDAHSIETLIEKSIYKKKPAASQLSVLKSWFVEFYLERNLPYKIFETQSVSPVSDFIASYSSGGSVFKDDRYYKLKGTYSKYSLNGKLLELSKANDKVISYITSYNDNYVIAQVENAKQNQIFHTSFETNGTIGAAYSGEKYYNNGSFTLPFTPPPDGAIYKMSYWYWDNDKWNFSGELPFQTVINNGTRIDEVRVYPVGAIMTTYTYRPGVGITSVTDSNNVTMFYEYDAQNRLKSIKDNNRHIIKTFEYHNKGSL